MYVAPVSAKSMDSLQSQMLPFRDNEARDERIVAKHEESAMTDVNQWHITCSIEAVEVKSSICAVHYSPACPDPSSATDKKFQRSAAMAGLASLAIGENVSVLCSQVAKRETSNDGSAGRSQLHGLAAIMFGIQKRQFVEHQSRRSSDFVMTLLRDESEWEKKPLLVLCNVRRTPTGSRMNSGDCRFCSKTLDPTSNLIYSCR